MFNVSEFLPKALSFIEEAGKIALEKRDEAELILKKDYSPVSESDRAISCLAHETFRLWLETPEHVMVDEEISSETMNKKDVFNSYEYQWVLDPIDGTASYLAGVDSWGILFAILKNGMPYLGFVYQPEKRVLYYTDGKKAMRVDHAFTPEQREKQVTERVPEISPNSFFSAHFAFAVQAQGYQKKLGKDKPWIFVDGWGVERYGYVADGSYIATLVGDYLWDFAAGWCLASVMGKKLYNLKTKEVVTSMNGCLLEDDWLIKEHHVLCAPEHIEKIHNVWFDK